MDLSAAVTELEEFKKVDFLSNYTLFDFDLDNPLSLSRFVTCVGLAFILMFFPILCCCTCKCFRKAAQALIKNVFKFIWWVLKGLWQILCGLVAYSRVREEEVLCASDLEVSVCFNATDRDSTDTGAMSALPGDEQLTFEMTQDFERRLDARRKVPRCWDRELEQVLEQRNSLAESSPRLRTNSFGGRPCRRILLFDSRSMEWLAPRFESSLILWDELPTECPASGEDVADRLRMFTMDLSPVLARPYVVQNVASQWRLEHLMDRSIRLVKGISFETLVFDLRESSVRNASGLDVVCEQPEHCLLDKFYRLAEH